METERMIFTSTLRPSIHLLDSDQCIILHTLCNIKIIIYRAPGVGFVVYAGPQKSNQNLPFFQTYCWHCNHTTVTVYSPTDV